MNFHKPVKVCLIFIIILLFYRVVISWDNQEDLKIYKIYFPTIKKHVLNICIYIFIEGLRFVELSASTSI